MPTTKTISNRPGKPTAFVGPWAVLREACGGTDKLAQRVGVTPHAVQDWALRGKKPSAPIAKLIGMLADELKVSNPLTTCPVCNDLGLRDPTPEELAVLRRQPGFDPRAPNKVCCERCVDAAYDAATEQS